MRNILFFLSLFPASSLVMAAEFNIQILSYPHVVYQWGPAWVTVEMMNVSGGPINVGYSATGFAEAFKVRRADGRARHGCSHSGQSCFIEGVKYEVLPADWRKIRIQNVLEGCEDDPGEYIVQFMLSSWEAGGRKSDGQGHMLLDKTITAWTGEILSEELHIEIIAPIGEDKEAYDSFQACLRRPGKRDILQHCRLELLSKFPTSAYGGYALLAVLKGSHGFTWWETPYKNFGFYESAKRDYIAGHSVEMFERLLKANEELIGMIETFLKSGRDDFSYTDELRADLAGRLAIQGKYHRARSICEALIAKKSTQGKNCSEFLQHLKEKGYLKQ